MAMKLLKNFRSGFHKTGSKPENEEGVRIDFKGEYGDGWLLLRMSLHEPLLVLQIENDLVGYQTKNS